MQTTTALLHKIHNIFLRRKTKFSQFSSTINFYMYGTFIYSGVITHNSALHFMPLHILRTHCRYKITVIIYRCHGKKSEVTWPISKVFKIISEYMHSIKVFKETLFCWELCDKLFSLKESLQIGRKLVFSAAPFQVYGMDVVTNCCALTSG